jgi:hypothetical protein
MTPHGPTLDTVRNLLLDIAEERSPYTDGLNLAAKIIGDIMANSAPRKAAATFPGRKENPAPLLDRLVDPRFDETYRIAADLLVVLLERDPGDRPLRVSVTEVAE